MRVKFHKLTTKFRFFGIWFCTKGNTCQFLNNKTFSIGVFSLKLENNFLKIESSSR